MNTVGKILHEARESKKMSLFDLEKITKIKSDFIDKIEKNDWDNLPEFPVVSGFVKNLASTLDLPVDNLNAIFRRDYLPKKIAINPKPDIQNKFSWSPKFSFFVGVIAFTFFILIYLLFEYKSFVTPPELEVFSPKAGSFVVTTNVNISGKTTTDSILTVNNQSIILDQDGTFRTVVGITKDTKKLVFRAVSRSGKVTEKTVEINVE